MCSCGVFAEDGLPSHGGYAADCFHVEGFVRAWRTTKFSGWKIEDQGGMVSEKGNKLSLKMR